MDTQKFREIVGPTIKEARKELQRKACGSLRPLAELLVKFYERRLTETEAQKGKCDNDN